MVNNNKENGLMTKVWGPPGWLFYHCVAFGYPYIIEDTNPKHFEKRTHYRNFYNNIGKVFPCKYCRESYDQFIKDIPIDNFLNNRRDLCYWTYLIHNKVNDKLGVPKCEIPSFEDIQKTYEQFRAKCTKTTEEKRKENIEKGCVRPNNGKYKRCVMKVVTCNKNSINNNYIVINKYLFFLIIFSYIFIIFYNFSHIRSFKKRFFM